MTFGPNGDLFVGNAGSGEILRVDPVTGAATVFGQIGGVGGLAYDANSNTLFATEFGNFDGDEVYQFNSTGTIINVIGTGSAATGRSGVALRGGDLYVGQFGAGVAFDGSVLKYDGTNNFAPLGVVASDPANGNQLDPSLNGANGLAFDAAGHLYVAGLFSQNVMRFSLAGGPATSGVPFVIPVAYPSALLVDVEAGNEVMYVTSLGNDRLADPIYTGFRFPGAVYKYDVSDGALIGSAPFISSGGVADFNNDGNVDIDDLTAWRGGYGPTDESGPDADNDLDVDGNDFLKWQQNVGKLGDFQPTAIALYKKPSAARPVPELWTEALAIAAVASGLWMRRVRLSLIRSSSDVVVG